MILQYNNRGQNDLKIFVKEDKSDRMVTRKKTMSLKEIRESYGLSQVEAASIVGVPVRTFRRYELDEQYGNCFIGQ